MTRPTPGTRDWWVETALITAGGVSLALWLWDGVPADRMEARQVTLADLFDDGCMTAETLQALRDGQRFTPQCPRPPTPSDDPTTQDRPFP